MEESQTIQTKRNAYSSQLARTEICVGAEF